MISTSAHNLTLQQRVALIVDDEKCLKIIETLLESSCMSGLPFREIARLNNLSHPDLSYHLNILIDAQLVMSRESELETLYFIDEVTMFRKLITYISELSMPTKGN